MPLLVYVLYDTFNCETAYSECLSHLICSTTPTFDTYTMYIYYFICDACQLPISSLFRSLSLSDMYLHFGFKEAYSVLNWFINHGFDRRNLCTFSLLHAILRLRFVFVYVRFNGYGIATHFTFGWIMHVSFHFGVGTFIGWILFISSDSRRNFVCLWKWWNTSKVLSIIIDPMRWSRRR